MPFNLGMGEVLVVLVVALLVFGGRLPEVGRSLGRGVVEFKKGLKGLAQDASRESEAQDAELPGAEPSENIALEDSDSAEGIARKPDSDHAENSGDGATSGNGSASSEEDRPQ